ncbi:MAG: hypothetical protein J6Y07_03280 [Alphaproteobacteria bacterium]|nr:hypothetical protein [Alphaproteobacteria bacterium]
MHKYLIIAVCALVIACYFFGARIAREKCVADGANAQTNEIINNVNMVRVAHEKTVHTGVRDIRDILRRKYTIAE